MCIDIEEDEESYYFTWLNIENSEDFSLLEERGCNYEVDDYETGEYVKIIRYLQRVAPHIRWRTTFDGTDRCGGGQWRVICVPDDQLSEAQYIFDRFSNGDDLENYSYTDKYSEIYDRLPNRQFKLKDHIIEFHGLLLEYEETLFSKKLNLASFFKKLATILPQMYFYANLLPYVSEAPDLEYQDVSEAPYIEYQGMMSFDRDLTIAPYDKFFCVPDPYDRNIETFLLSDLLLSLHEDIEQGLLAFSTSRPELIAAAVNDWRVGFSIEHGWGRDILIALLASHQVKRKIKNQ